MQKPLALLGLAMVAGCSTPAQVEQARQLEVQRGQYIIADAEQEYREDIREAVEWNSHVWGIPASGWVAIFIVVGLATLALLAFALYLWSEARSDRRSLENSRAKREQEIRLAAVKADHCPNCGFTAVQRMEKA